MWSAIIHVVLLGLLLSGAFFGHEIVQKIAPRQTVTLIAPSPDSYALPTAKTVISGGGGGGDHDPLPAPKGRLPKAALQQITPPAIIMRNEKPKLAVEPTVVIPPQVHVADNHMPNLGTATAAPMPAAPPSNGTGSGGGIGSGSGGGVGVGHGAGVGAGSGGGIGGGVYKVGGGISAPQAISAPDPDYTEEARRAKKQGTCVLWLIVDAAGHPRDIKVVRGLGLGLDAKALGSREAVALSTSIEGWQAGRRADQRGSGVPPLLTTCGGSSSSFETWSIGLLPYKTKYVPDCVLERLRSAPSADLRYIGPEA